MNMKESNIMDKVESTLVPLANKLNTNKVIQSISKGLLSLMSIIMIGAFATLFKQLPLEPYQDFIKNTGLANMLAIIVNITNNMVALYAAFSIAYVYTNNENMDGFSAGFISLCSFLLLTPMNSSGEGLNLVTNLPLSWLGAKGLFTAMIVAIVSANIYCFIIKKKITIKLPDSVPEFVSKSFTAIIPGVLVIILFSIISMIMSNTTFGSFHSMIYSLIALPLNNLGGTIWAAIIIYTLSGLCWFCGIHGIAVISVVLPIWMSGDLANRTAIAAGEVAPNLITYNWTNAVAGAGGAGCTIGLMLLCTFTAKSKRYKEFGKIGLVPNLFNINEPVVFGMPCMLNPILAIPFICLPVVFIIIAYILTQLGILPVGNGIGAPGGTPVILAGLFNGGWRLAIWQLVTIVISIFAYFPFFKVMDKKAVEEESMN